MPKVSVILPVFNGGKFVENTIRRLCKSTLKDIEIIVIDDGSSDNSYEICCKCAQKDKKVNVYKKKNEGGVFAARNFGLDKAVGEYVCFCDQDDVIELNMYERMYNQTIDKSPDIVICSTGRLLEGKKIKYNVLPNIRITNKKKIQELILSNLFNNTDLYKGNNILISNTIWNCMIKRDFICNNKLRFHKYINSEDDWIFVLNMLSKANSIVLMSDILYYWRVNTKSESYVSGYVDNLYEKNKLLQNEIENIMRKTNIDNYNIEKFHKHYNCIRYVALIENELKNSYDDIKSKISRLRIIESETDYKKSLKMRKYYHKNLIRKIVALGLLERNLFGAAYVFLYLFRKVKMFFLKYCFWTKLEINMSAQK